VRSVPTAVPKAAASLLFLVVAFTLSILAGCATGQPHMRSALDHLVAARSELQAALADKGGHRERAIELVDIAIAETERGMEFARRR
jgi:hypothetical protein